MTPEQLNDFRILLLVELWERDLGQPDSALRLRMSLGGAIVQLSDAQIVTICRAVLGEMESGRLS